MGQTTSREHAPLTFGYVNDSVLDIQDASLEELDQKQQDFVLANPHLYQLQAICRECTPEIARGEVFVSSVNESCSVCKKRKRLSLVKKDLADDLDYIDQTYYPDLVHYSTTAMDPMESELLQLEGEDDDEDKSKDQWSRLTIGDITPGKMRPRRLTGPSMAVDLSNRSLVKLSPSIGYLNNLTKLNLSNNQMMEIPREVGYLRNLRVLNISNNLIQDIPDTVSLLSKLKALNVSQNRVSVLPDSIGQLFKLVIIIVNDNRLKSIPRELAQLPCLVSLNVANNPLKSLPAEFAALPTLRKLITEGCAFEEEYSFELKHDPPSLFEQCARQVAQSHTEIPNQLAEHIKDYLLTAQTCSYCKGPFFDSHVTRTRFIDRVGQVIAFDYKLCCSHWTDENDRIHAMFSTQPTQPGRNHKIDTEGLSDSIMKTNQRIRSNSNSSIGSNSSKEDAIPLYRLKSLPDLPPLQHSHTLPGPSHTPKNGYNRPRASSGASVTKRLTNFISRTSSSTLKERSHSSINLSAHLTSNGSSSNLA